MRTGQARWFGPSASMAFVLLLTSCSAAPNNVAFPHGWKPVSYGGLIIDVPPTWTIYQRQDKRCGIPGPGVLVGRQGDVGGSCLHIRSVGPVLVFGGPDLAVPVGHETNETINGVEAIVSKSTSSPGYIDYGNGVDIPQYMSEEVVRFPGRGVWLDARAPGKQAGGVLRVVDQIVATVRPSA